MNSVSLLLALSLGAIDCLTLWIARDLLFDFLCGNTSRNRARHLRKVSTIKEKITMSYIRPHIKYEQDIVDFKKYYFLYKIEWVSILPQYMAIVALGVFKFIGAQFVFLCAFIAVKLVVYIVFKIPSWPMWRSKYAKKPGNRK